MRRKNKIIPMLWLLIPAFFLCGPDLTAQMRSQKDSRQKITVRVMDGITGLPKRFEFPNIWIGPRTDSGNPRLNVRGEVQIDLTEASPRTMRFLPNWYADCRYDGDVGTGMEVRYSLDDILETGVVGKNVCGGFHAKPQPGVIVFYVRHRRLFLK